MKKRYQKHLKTELPSRRKLASELAKQEQRAKWASQRAESANLARDELCSRVWRIEEENQRLIKQVGGLSSFKQFVHVSPSPKYTSRDSMVEHARTQQVSMDSFHVGVDFGLSNFIRMERGERGAFIDAVADHVAREARKAVIANLRVI